MALHVMDEANHCLGCKVPRCQQGCPIHTNIPEVIRLLKANKLDEAGRMLFENNPLTTVCSLVCNHENQCEGHCVRGIKGAPVHFSVIENYISSTYASQMTQGPAPSNGKKAAIIGSGPAGLTIAVLITKSAVLVGHHKRLLARKAVKVVKALPQGRPDHAAQVTHLRLRKPARSQRLARRGHHRPARIGHRAVKIEQHDRPLAYLQRLHRHSSSPVDDFHTDTSNC